MGDPMCRKFLRIVKENEDKKVGREGCRADECQVQKGFSHVQRRLGLGDDSFHSIESGSHHIQMGLVFRYFQKGDK